MVKVQWYPGHMEKARRQMAEVLKHIDLVIEIRDARIPRSSANPLLDELAAGKPRLVLLSKEDLADPAVTAEWLRVLQSPEQSALAVSLAEDASVRKKTLQEVRRLYEPRRQKQIARGIRSPRPARVLVCGVPNVGKSTLINRIAGHKIARAEDRPGVTRAQTWIHADPQVDLLDTPGVLWPKFEEEQTGTMLAAVGSIEDRLVDPQMLAMDVIHVLMDRYPGHLQAIYQAPPEVRVPGMLDAIARCRHLLDAAGKPDRHRAAVTFLQEFRRGQLGRLSLESADETDT